MFDKLIDLVIFVTFTLFLSPAFSAPCHPPINAGLPQYMIGYGSFMDERSKQETDPTAGINFPVLVDGYKRSWAIHGDLPGINTTFLSVSKAEGASFNGVIFKLNPSAIPKFDERETDYCRKEVDSTQLHLFSIALPKDKQIWLYSSALENQPPTAAFPIVQSYVDLFIRGCIQVENNYKLAHFAEKCIKSTAQWSAYWENDRIFPRRPASVEPQAPQIDKLLKATLPTLFSKIKQGS